MRVARPTRLAVTVTASLLPIYLFLVPGIPASAFPGSAAHVTVGRAELAEDSQPNVTGTYRGNAPAGDAAKRVFTLTLAADGSAAFITLYVGKDSVTERGRWTQQGTQLTLNFDAIGSNAPPRPITFRYRHHALHPILWDQSEWGGDGPPILYRSQIQASPSDS